MTRSISSWILGSFLLILWLSSCQKEVVWSRASILHKVSMIEGNLKQTWVQSNVFADDNRFGILLAANQGKVFLSGSLDPNNLGGIITLDGSTGDVLWQNRSGAQSTLFATPSALYVGSYGTGRVTAYDLNEGQTLWSTAAPGARAIWHLHVIDQTVQASSEKFFYVLHPDTGEVLERLGMDFDQEIFIKTDEVIFIQRPSEASLQRIDTSSGGVIWEANVSRAYTQIPIFTDKIVFVVTNYGIGSVDAIDGQTGKTLWTTQRNVISENIAVTKSGVYFLTLDQGLIEANPTTGEVTARVEFEPSAFLLNDEAEYNVGGYYVAADEEAEMVYLLLGDSAQLFAFKVE